MTTIAVAFVLALTCGAVFTPLAIKLAHRLNAVDHALSSRKIHKAPIPRLGGIAIAAAFFAPVTGLLLVDSGVGRLFYGSGLRPLGLYLGGVIVAGLGVYDDLKGTGAKTKFLVQFAVAALVYALGYRIDALANPFGPALQLGWLGLPFTMLWIAGVINAINLIDGLDGLAGGVSLVAVSMIFALAFFNGDAVMMLFCAALAGALLGFLRYNYNPARIFMGDTGSMFLGFVLATSAIQTSHKSTTAVAILVPIVVLGFPITDTLLAMGRRAMRGAPLFQADRGHIHHRLLDSGLSQRATAVVLWSVSLLLGLTALALAYASSFEAGCLLALLALGSTLALRRLGYMHLHEARVLFDIRRRNLSRRAAVAQIAERLRSASHEREVWATVLDATPHLGAATAGLRLAGKTSGSRVRHFCDAVMLDLEDRVLVTRHSLQVERPGDVLELGWTDGRSELDRDTELVIEQLCANVHAAVSRIERTRAAVPTSNVVDLATARLQQSSMQKTGSA